MPLKSTMSQTHSKSSHGLQYWFLRGLQSAYVTSHSLTRVVVLSRWAFRQVRLPRHLKVYHRLQSCMRHFHRACICPLQLSLLVIKAY
jgi:hypothetical protein